MLEIVAACFARGEGGMTQGDKITFPCGGLYEVGEVTTTQRLQPVDPGRRLTPEAIAAWGNGHVVAYREGARQFRIDFGFNPWHAVYVTARKEDYAGGAWPNGEPMAFILRKDGADLVLSVHRAKGERGPYAVEGVDGNE
jgi:hypothetical protein